MRLVRYFWVVTERGDHDDIESLERAVSEQATSASAAWKVFLRLHGCRASYREWRRRGYVARRVTVAVYFSASCKG